MTPRWYQEAVIYSAEIGSFQDSDGDGHGDIRGFISRLDYLGRLGITCLWLNPIHPSPWRDDGYDVADYYGVDPKLGSLGDFVELVRRAKERGIRILLDLVVNHTSDTHPWFVSARSDPASPYRDWYIWSADEPANAHEGMVFPGEQTSTWTYDDQAGAWYFHRFYDFQPDLNFANPAVRTEIAKIMSFWLQLGVAGFRVDAAPFVLEQTAPGENSPPLDFAILDSWRQALQWQTGDAVLLLEANVPPDQVTRYAGTHPDGWSDRAQMIFDFLLNPKAWLALAREDAEPLVDGLTAGVALPKGAQWATFLRNHDELDLSRLTSDQRADVMRRFAGRRSMRLYGRGIRRRLAPMLHGDQRHVELAYALQFALPGTPVLRYGEEIGMSENLALPERDGLRTPMQWDETPNAGFSTADPERLIRPVTMAGRYGARTVNVRAQLRDPNSLFRWFQNLISTLRSAPEIGTGTPSVIDVPLPRSVLAHRFDAPSGSILLLHNLADRAVTLDIGALDGTDGAPYDLMVDGPYEAPHRDLNRLRLNGWGYRWIRLARSDNQ